METSCRPKYFFTSEIIESESHIRFLPVMVARLILSLKKAAALQGSARSFGVPNTNSAPHFAARRRVVSTGDDICLDTLATTYEGARSPA